MPIASKLLYFQRRPSPAPPDPPLDPPDPRRRPCRGTAAGPRRPRSGALSHHYHHHHKPGQELLPGSQRDGVKLVGSAGNIIEHIGSMGSSSRLNRSVSLDQGRLPDAVQQARDRLLQRLNSVDLSGRRQKTASSETIWAPVTHPADVAVSTSADSELHSLTSYLQSSVSIGALKVQECIADKRMPITPCTEPDPTLQEPACEEGENATHSAECSICLERCGGPNGLIQLHCKHIFHSACLERWLRSRGDCPYCRASVLLTSDG